MSICFAFSSQRDVFGNLLNSLLTVDTQPLIVHPENSKQNPELDQYHPDFILWELNKAYTGFHCQQDRGDISTELLALSIKRGSLAFVAEDYPECGAPFHITSRQSDLGNIPESTASHITRGPVPVAVVEPNGGVSSPLSPIPEMSETPSFSSFLADDIVQAGLKQVEVGSASSVQKAGGEAEEGVVEKLLQAMFDNPADFRGNDSDSTISSLVTPSMDELATTLASSIVNSSAQAQADEAAASVVVKTVSTEALEKRSSSIAKSIIADILVMSSPQTVGESSSSSSVEGLSTMATDLSGNILSEVLDKCSLRPNPPVSIQLEGKDRRISSLTNYSNTALHEYINEMTNRAIDEGLAAVEESLPAATVSTLEKPQARLQATARREPETDIDVIKLAESLVVQSIQNSLRRVQPEVAGEASPNLPSKRQPPVHQGLPLGIPSDGTPPFSSSPTASSPVGPLSTQSMLVDPKSQDTLTGGSRELNDPDVDTQSAGSNLNSRLLTPMSSRAGYAWSIASTRDEDSRPVSPTDLNKLGLSLSNNTDEFSSLFSDIVINNAISNVTGENVSPHTINTEAKEAEDCTSLPSSSKIGIFLSKLGEAETPSDQTSTWQNIRHQLLRPITTGPWKGGAPGKQGDPQVMAMVQWMAASASGRPRIFYYNTFKDEHVREVS